VLHIASNLVARDAELEVFERTLERLIGGQPTVLLVVGNPASETRDAA
jgi:hypothetical protein